MNKLLGLLFLPFVCTNVGVEIKKKETIIKVKVISFLIKRIFDSISKPFYNRAILTEAQRRSTRRCETWRDFSRFTMLSLFFQPIQLVPCCHFLFPYRCICYQEELEFVDDLRALYDKKLISNEAKVKVQREFLFIVQTITQGNVGAYISSLMDVIGEQEEDASFIHNPVNAYNLLRCFAINQDWPCLSLFRVDTLPLVGAWWKIHSRLRWRGGRRMLASASPR